MNIADDHEVLLPAPASYAHTGWHRKRKARMLVVLGGSSPWTTSLIMQLRDAKILLVGRDQGALEALQMLSRKAGADNVEISTDAAAALRSATLVLCQARIGGWEGRLSDEVGPARWGGFGDETLGLGGLRSALRASSTIRTWAEAAGDVPAIMFTNPTDLLARMWSSCSGGPCVSVCEMPTLMLKTLPPRTSYLGVNHLGYAYSTDGALLPTKWIETAIDLPRHVKDQLEQPPQRARLVSQLAAALRRAIHLQDLDEVAHLLSERPPRWYELIIIPLVRSLLFGAPFRGVLGLPNGGRLLGVAPGVIVEGYSSARTPEPVVAPTVVIEKVTAFARSRELGWRFLRAPAHSTLKDFLYADPFSRGVASSHELLAWLTQLQPTDYGSLSTSREAS